MGFITHKARGNSGYLNYGVYIGAFVAIDEPQFLLAKLKRPVVKNPVCDAPDCECETYCGPTYNNYNRMCTCGTECGPGEEICEDCFIYESGY